MRDEKNCEIAFGPSGQRGKETGKKTAATIWNCVCEVEQKASLCTRPQKKKSLSKKRIKNCYIFTGGIMSVQLPTIISMIKW